MRGPVWFGRNIPTRLRTWISAHSPPAIIQGYSVTAEVFADQASAGRLAKAAWEQIYTLGRTPVSAMREVSDQIEQAQAAAS